MKTYDKFEQGNLERIHLWLLTVKVPMRKWEGEGGTGSDITY